jgi:coniferyl-aldehyde dehydrogenase
MEGIFKSQRQAYLDDPYPKIDLRVELLSKLKFLLQENATEIARAIAKDFTHRAYQESYFLEVFPSIHAIKYYIKHTKRLAKPRKRSVDLLFQPANAWIFPQPKGIVGIIVPWNYPLFLAMSPLAGAIAAGNRVMIKMSEYSTHLGELLVRLFNKAGISENQIAIINGDVEIAKKFNSLAFSHLLFTGSTNVGKLVMGAASQNLTPVTLELGGKSPAILSKTMNEAYFSRLFMGKLFNAGQTCIAPDYLFIPKGWEKKVRMAVKECISKHYPNSTTTKDYSCVINENQLKRLNEYLDDAKEKGASIETIGKGQDKYMPLSIVFDVNQDMRLMNEEIFGPILPIMTYDSFAQVISYINNKGNPLSLYYFGNDKSEIKMLQSDTISGALSINDTLIHGALNTLPFGGVGASGMGCYHGQEGFDTFSQLKPVFKRNRFSPVSFLYPPYGKMIKIFLKFIGGLKIKE